MKDIIKLVFAFVCLVVSLLLMGLMALSEIGFKNLQFAMFFGIFATLGAVVFFVLTRGDDNEETNPGKEKIRR